MKSKYKYLFGLLFVTGLAFGAGPTLFKDILITSSAKIGGTGLAAASSALEINSTTKGMLPPRMTTTQRDAISSPATGLVVYNTTTTFLNYYNGTSWLAVGSGTSGSGVVAYRTATTTDTMTTADQVLFANASSAAFTVNLPTAVGNAGRVFQVIKVDTDNSKFVTIDPNGSQTIGGNLTLELRGESESASFVSDGSNWTLLDRGQPKVKEYSVRIAYTGGVPAVAGAQLGGNFISSVTDNGTGDFTLNFTSGTFGTIVHVSADASSGAQRFATIFTTSTSSTRILLFSDAGTAVDVDAYVTVRGY